MAEYLVYHGSLASGRDSSDPGLISFKSDGVTISIRGPKDAVTTWAKIAGKSTAIAVTASSEPDMVLWRFFMSNKMASWSYFTDDNGYDKYRSIYDDVKGTTVKVKIVPRELPGFDVR